MVSMFDRALMEHPDVVLIAVALTGLLVVVAIAFAMDAFVGWAEREPVMRPHPFSPLNPGHCEVCWREADRRRAKHIVEFRR
ncbi:MAG TPA: hypothetical protein VN654_24060 [Vicinamibacterales bacterium]|nr:hypothetical protein [Vicinamibacterales bacterium]